MRTNASKRTASPASDGKYPASTSTAWKTSSTYFTNYKNPNKRMYMGRHILRNKKKPALKNTGTTLEKRPKQSGKQKPDVVMYQRHGRDDDEFQVPRVNEPTGDVYDRLKK